MSVVSNISAIVTAALRPLRERIFQEARPAGRRKRPSARPPTP